MTSLFELFQRGGPVMWPILICSILAFAIAMERFLTLSRMDMESSQFLKEVTPPIRTGQLAVAQRLCDRNSTPLARMVKAGIRRYGRGRSEIREAMEEVGSREVHVLDRYVPMLGTIAHCAPLLGLLGTVTGLVRCFQVIQEKATSINPVNPGDLAGGIWEALLTTVFGLLVAIPAYTMYNYLVHRINGFVKRMESDAAECADLLEGAVWEEPVSRHAI